MGIGRVTDSLVGEASELCVVVTAMVGASTASGAFILSIDGIANNAFVEMQHGGSSRNSHEPRLSMCGSQHRPLRKNIGNAQDR